MDNRTRDFYVDLFSPDTVTDSSSLSDFEHISSQHKGDDFLLTNMSLLNNEKTHIEVNPTASNFDESAHSQSDSDMDISDSSCSSNSSISLASSEETPKVDPVISFLEEDDIAHLLGENVSLPQPEPRETLEKENVDIIASFNVRNKYNHITAAELLIREKISFLSIQEPYASSHKASESWKAFQRLELESARITAYETPFQMILFDSWKWGGQILLPFQSLQYGRIASIAFDLGKKFKLGIISVYAPTRDASYKQLPEEQAHPPLQITNMLVQKILKKWKSEYPDMLTLVLGDFQETISKLDKDNFGNFRQDPTEGGLVTGLSNSHESIVRNRNPDTPYVTRFGKEGARGIDHIFFPQDEKFDKVCLNAKIQRDVGANYFPSDHSLITCSLSRFSQNNNCSGNSKVKYSYNKIFSIKMKQSGILGRDINFDTSQFKNCRKFKEQADMYMELQKRTGDDSVRSNSHLSDLENRIKKLFADLWSKGLHQNTHGPSNKLIEISDSNAAELSYILNKYNESIKTIMMDLNLMEEKNSNDSAGTIRGNLRKKNGFKLFNNLPVPTKLRYLRLSLEKKIREMQKSLYWLQEAHIRNNHDPNFNGTSESNDFWKDWIKIKKDDGLTKKASDVSNAYTIEETERLMHVSAIEFESDKRRKKKAINMEDDIRTGNMLPSVPDNVVRLLNFWLAGSKCNQGFNTSATNGVSPAFLTQRISDWKEHLVGVDIRNTDLSIKAQVDFVSGKLNMALADVQKLSTQTAKLQVFYRKATLDYFLDSSDISSFTNKVLPKGRQAPAAHTSIWDPGLQDFRPCSDELEELRATSAYHGNWMANSKSNEICAFAKLFKVGRLGNRGINLFPSRIVTIEDIPNLIPNGASLPKRIQKAFVKAHGKHTANLFKEPPQDNPEFFYPFYLIDKKGGIMNGEKLEEDLWKSISSIPSKARFDGFQLAVIGRLGPRWRHLLLNIIKLILIMRYVPTSLKRMARFPIPKPGKQNEYRPISLCHDLYCYIMGIITSFSSAAIARSGILHEGLTAYQKGKGCMNLVTTELSFREDCLESKMPAVQIDEDEEKFFDRIPVEILLAAMRVNGFPSQGYIEIKASAMEAKTVEIITAKGVTYARFICGLEQGNPDSPTVSNLVIKFKHDVWGCISDDIKKLLAKNGTNGRESYMFNSLDKLDGQVFLCKIGYSDDNSKFISVKNEEELLALVKYFTQLSGDISMVTKIGRKSAKCEIQFFNISAELAIKMEKIWSTAWSFVDDSPIEEQIPFRIHMKARELQRFYSLMDFFKLEEAEQMKWNKIVNADAQKHLGLLSTLGANTSAAWAKTIDKMTTRVSLLKLQKMHSTAQRKCFNMLIGSMQSFAPMQTNFPNSELRNFDQHIIKTCLKSNGISKSDSKLRMFLPERMGGLGLVSTLELDIVAVAREFEIISNNDALDSRSFRTRISALRKYDPMENIFQNKNHARDAITKLAKYGIFVRDSKDCLINDIMALLCKESKRFLPLSHPNYKDPCRSGIGLGKTKNTFLMLGGPVHSVLCKLEMNNWQESPEITHLASFHRISVAKLLLKRRKVQKNKNDGILNFFSYYEWRNSRLESVQKIPEKSENWVKFVHDFSINSLDDFHSEYDVIAKCVEDSRFPWKQHIRMDKITKALMFNTYSWEGLCLQFILNSKSPILVATDGSHSLSASSTDHNRNTHDTTSSFVLCVLDIRDNETLISGEWADRPVLPILSRIAVLPTNFGNCNSDIAYGEFCAFIMAEAALHNLPRITISDSKAVRNQVLNIRDIESYATDRNYIRSIAGGMGKYVCGLMKSMLQDSKISSSTTNLDPVSIELFRIFTERNSSFLDIANNWRTPSSTNSESGSPGWDISYLDKDVNKPILKVNSHQLDNSGRKIKDSPRYKNLAPNLALLSANHFADACADYGKKFILQPYSLDRPPPFLRYFFTCNGKNIDRHLSNFLYSAFSELKIKKLQSNITQGLLWRILHLTTTSWEILSLYKGWFRSLLGLSSTHTRRIYKSSTYRECCKAVILSKTHVSDKCAEIKKATTSKLIDLLSPCLWCQEQSHGLRKGNRNHLFLQCNNNDILHFRVKISNLIESKLRIFFTELKRVTNEQHVAKCVGIIEKKFLHAQKTQEGRLSKMNENLNTRYLPIDTILSRERLSSISEAMDSRQVNFLSEVFGLIPNGNGTEILDDQIGITDCPWLGLTPIFVDKAMLDTCYSIHHFINHKESANILINSLKHSWKEIMNLIMGKAIGLHRIIGSTGTRLEKEWRKEFDIDINSISKTKKEIKKLSSQSGTGIKFRRIKRKLNISNFNPVQNNKKQRTCEGVQQNEANTKLCSGLTCDKRNSSWYPNSQFSPNRVKCSIKHCQRCSRFMTALRKAHSILTHITKLNPEKEINALYNFFKDNTVIKGHKYNICKKIINECLPTNLHINSSTNTRSFTDGFKLLCSIFGICIRKSTHNFSINESEFIQQAIVILDKTLTRKESDFSLDRIAEAKIKLLTAINKKGRADNSSESSDSAIPISKLLHSESIIPSTSTSLIPSRSIIPIPISNITKTTSNNETKTNVTNPSKSHASCLAQRQSRVTPLPDLQMPKLKEFASAVLRPSRLLHGLTMMRAIEVLRSFKIPNTFFASAEASNQINAWQTHQQWKFFAKIFGNRLVVNNKLNGTYFIPIFSGVETGGHWSLCVIHKFRSRMVKGWCLDSLGSTSLEDCITKKIEYAFMPGRGSFTWVSCRCRRQEELECGPRTILAMQSIQQNLSQNIQIKECITRASLMGVSRHVLTPEKIREKVAQLLNRFHPDMITPLIRFSLGRRSGTVISSQNPANSTKRQKVVIDLASTSSQDSPITKS